MPLWRTCRPPRSSASQATINGVVTTLSSGDSFYVPPNTLYELFNSSAVIEAHVMYVIIVPETDVPGAFNI